jgi:molecular chaperone DnaJ
VKVAVTTDARFDRVGDELHHRVEIGITEAVFGTTVEVPVIDGGSETVEIAGGTQPETVYQFAKKGMPRLRRRGRGDLFVHVGVVIPTDLDSEQEDLLWAYGERRAEHPEPRKRRLFRR